MGDLVSNTDSFIDEVSEEVRRDQLFAYLRRYGWIAVVCVLALVGGAGYVEYTKAQETAAAQATGDALLAALSEDDLTARAAALDAAQPDGPARVVAALLQAASAQETGDLAAAAAALESIATDSDVAPVYRDIAAFKKATLKVEGVDDSTRRATFETLAKPGNTFRLLAMEQLAMMDVSAGDTDAAVAQLQAILEDDAVTRGLRARGQAMLVALGQDLDPAASE